MKPGGWHNRLLIITIWPMDYSMTLTLTRLLTPRKDSELTVQPTPIYVLYQWSTQYWIMVCSHLLKTPRVFLNFWFLDDEIVSFLSTSNRLDGEPVRVHFCFRIARWLRTPPLCSGANAAAKSGRPNFKLWNDHSPADQWAVAGCQKWNYCWSKW